MTGKFRISYSFDDMMDENPYQAKAMLPDRTSSTETWVDVWGTSYGEAKDKLIKIIESIPDEEEIEICGI